MIKIEIKADAPETENEPAFPYLATSGTISGALFHVQGLYAATTGFRECVNLRSGRRLAVHISHLKPFYGTVTLRTRKETT